MDPVYYESKVPYEQAQDNHMYLKIGIVAIGAAILTAAIVYYAKPTSFLKIKGDKNSGLDLGLVLLTCTAVFVVTVGIVFLLYRSAMGPQRHGQLPAADNISEE